MHTQLTSLAKKKVLLTGWQGFLGGHLLNALKDFPFEIGLYEGDVRDFSSFNQSFDTVVHLAAYNKMDGSLSETELFDTNVCGTAAVMHYCHKNGASCIFASSAAVYRPVQVEGCLSETALLDPITRYGISKLLAENICRQFSSQQKVPVMALRIFNLYGPGQANSFLIPQMVQFFSQNNELILNNPLAVRDFVHVGDVVNAIILACNHKHHDFMALNVGTGQGISVREVGLALGRIMGVMPKLTNCQTPPKTDYVVADITQTRIILNWTPQITLVSGLCQVFKG